MTCIVSLIEILSYIFHNSLQSRFKA